jgi:TPR repeat protein
MNEYGVARDIILEGVQHGYEALDLGVAYYNGEDRPRDYQQARHYLELAADYHSAKACFFLHVMAKIGQGYPAPDLEEALRWLELSWRYGGRDAEVESMIRSLKEQIENQKNKPVFNVKTRRNI